MSSAFLHRTVRVAMQVPVVMTTSQGQKISTVAVQQPPVATGAASPTTILTNTSSVSAAANANSQQKVCSRRSSGKVLFLRNFASMFPVDA